MVSPAGERRPRSVTGTEASRAQAAAVPDGPSHEHPSQNRSDRQPDRATLGPVTSFLPTTEDPQSQLDRLSWPFRTDRLIIRRCAPADLEALWAYRGLPEVSRWTSWHPADQQDWYTYQGDPARMARTLVLEHEGSVAGDLMLMIQDAWAQREAADEARGTQAELGWALNPAHGGQGLATEAVREMIRICFAELGLRRVTASAFADNERSARVMERVGMRREAYNVKESFHRDLGWLDGIEYALLAEEWRATR